jgi:hypothetical protein
MDLGGRLTWDEPHFIDSILCYGFEHSPHLEFRQHDDLLVEEEREESQLAQTGNLVGN